MEDIKPGSVYEYRQRLATGVHYRVWEKDSKGNYDITEMFLTKDDIDVVIKMIESVQLVTSNTKARAWIVQIGAKNESDPFKNSFYTRLSNRYMSMHLAEVTQNESKEDPHQGMVWYPMDQEWRYV